MTDQASEGLLSPYLRAKRVAAVQPYLRGDVLDFGCGSGALAKLVDPAHYLGIEIDPSSLRLAEQQNPRHRFMHDAPDTTRKFQTVVSLAVIEHAQDPTDFLRTLTSYLADGPMARIVVTTPHPSTDWVHGMGAAIGLFSKHANEEHGDLLDREKLVAIGKQNDLDLESYSRFLFGANQIAAYKKVARQA